MAYLIIAYIIFGFLVLRFFVVLTNFISRLKPPVNLKITDKPLVSILIPARNEEKNIGNILNDILIQDYNNIEIIIYDDDSEDNTAEIIREFINQDERITIIKGQKLPENWLGKNYACHQLSTAAKGTYLLFLDADIRISKNIIENTIAYSNKNKLSLLSIFPMQEMHSTGEKLTVPIMNWILLSLLPMFLIKKCSWTSFSAANGQFMLFNASDYIKHYWHKIVKNEKVEDIKILRLMKKSKYEVHTLLGDKRIKCRMYSSYKEGLNGFSKNVLAFFSNSISFMLFFTFCSLFGVFYIAFMLNWRDLILYLFLSFLMYIMISIISKQNIKNNLLYLIPRQFSFGLIVLNSLYYKLMKKGKWKGRIIY